MFGTFGGLGGFVLVLLGVIVYLLPSLIAFNRDVELRWVVLVINIFLGASLIGWLVALYLATRKPKQQVESTA
ncbi:superinfection immunity protein [Streptomyces sp. NPDC059900]|uniref:superinfection immunity protein n=1 Tax=Streptomyces sp. NPDC059900 TaxID=3155816 RepID=UPI00343CA5CA